MMNLQQPQMTIRHRLLNLFHSDSHGTKIILGEMALVMALGFGWNVVSGAPLQNNVAVMGHILPVWMWTAMWALYCGLRLQSAINDGQTMFIKYTTALMGLWLWGCMLFAGVMMEVHDNTVYLYVGPMQIEIWILLQNTLWWTKYDPTILSTVPGALEPTPHNSIIEENDRAWAGTRMFPDQ